VNLESRRLHLISVQNLLGSRHELKKHVDQHEEETGVALGEVGIAPLKDNHDAKVA
jgi:hypothetical protein